MTMIALMYAQAKQQGKPVKLVLIYVDVCRAEVQYWLR